MTIKELLDKMEELAPVSLAESWDNVGLLAGRMDREIEKVLVTLDADSDAVCMAKEQGCNLIISHHPLIFSPMKSIREDDFIGIRLIEMLEHKISYAAIHTNFDIAVMADLADAYLGIDKIRPLMITGENNGDAYGIGSVGTLREKLTLRELSILVKNTFDLPDVRYYGQSDQVIEKIAMCPGSGKGMDQDALNAGADVLITGDVDHHYGIDCVEKGLMVIDAGHHGIEHIFVDYMAKYLKKYLREDQIVQSVNRSPFQVV